MTWSDVSMLFEELDVVIKARLGPFATNRIDPHGYRLEKIREFLEALKVSNASLSLQSVAAEIRSVIAGPFASGSSFGSPDGSSCLTRLSTSERQVLEEHLEDLIEKIRIEFPELVDEFPGQFPGRKVA